MRKLALITGAALLASVGAAQAESMVLNEEQLDQVSAGGFVYFTTDVYKDVDIKVNEYIDIYKDVDAHVHIKGNLATAQASADAIGYNTLSETSTFAQAVEGYLSQSYSESIAGTDGGYYHYRD